jgi:hypothetical protein
VAKAALALGVSLDALGDNHAPAAAARPKRKQAK